MKMRSLPRTSSGLGKILQDFAVSLLNGPGAGIRSQLPFDFSIRGREVFAASSPETKMNGGPESEMH
jgi:hypothetical protein